MKGETLRKRRSAAPIIRQYAGDYVHANYWVKVGLTRNQLAAMSAIARAHGCRHEPVATTARWLVMLGLDCLSALEDRSRQLAEDCNDALGQAGQPDWNTNPVATTIPSTIAYVIDGRAKQLAVELQKPPLEA